jgi:hypothetical protein
MKTLSEILRDAKLLLDSGRENVVIARGNDEPLDCRSQAYKIKLRHDVDTVLSVYRCETSSWLGEQWSNWTERGGWLGGAAFDIDDVLATDWRIIS